MHQAGQGPSLPSSPPLPKDPHGAPGHASPHPFVRLGPRKAPPPAAAPVAPRVTRPFQQPGWTSPPACRLRPSPHPCPVPPGARGSPCQNGLRCTRNWVAQVWKAHEEETRLQFPDPPPRAQQRGNEALLPFLWAPREAGRMNFIFAGSLLSESLPLFSLCIFSHVFIFRARAGAGSAAADAKGRGALGGVFPAGF